MADRYDTTKPRFSVCNQTRARLDSDESHLTRTFEVLNPNEARFWISIGYTVEESWFDPKLGIFI